MATNPHHTLGVLYNKILSVVQKMPADTPYRKHTEVLVKERNTIVQAVRMKIRLRNASVQKSTITNSSIQLFTLDSGHQGYRDENRLRPSRGIDRASRERTDPCPKNARMEAVGGTCQPSTTEAMGLAPSSDSPGPVNGLEAELINVVENKL